MEAERSKRDRKPHTPFTLASHGKEKNLKSKKTTSFKQTTTISTSPENIPTTEINQKNEQQNLSITSSDASTINIDKVVNVKNSCQDPKDDPLRAAPATSPTVTSEEQPTRIKKGRGAPRDPYQIIIDPPALPSNNCRSTLWSASKGKLTWSELAEITREMKLSPIQMTELKKTGKFILEWGTDAEYLKVLDLKTLEGKTALIFISPFLFDQGKVRYFIRDIPATPDALLKEMEQKLKQLLPQVDRIARITKGGIGIGRLLLTASSRIEDVKSVRMGTRVYTLVPDRNQEPNKRTESPQTDDTDEDIEDEKAILRPTTLRRDQAKHLLNPNTRRPSMLPHEHEHFAPFYNEQGYLSDGDKQLLYPPAEKGKLKGKIEKGKRFVPRRKAGKGIRIFPPAHCFNTHSGPTRGDLEPPNNPTNTLISGKDLRTLFINNENNPLLCRSPTTTIVEVPPSYTAQDNATGRSRTKTKPLALLTVD